mmetsp:Transcript_30838/g.45969  ORF Transcript_30838/g.45969 Transcript_30838/m.45969 type:complete len:224 (-) Transcript_30838:303-974(-)
MMKPRPNTIKEQTKTAMTTGTTLGLSWGFLLRTYSVLGVSFLSVPPPTTSSVPPGVIVGSEATSNGHVFDVKVVHVPLQLTPVEQSDPTATMKMSVQDNPLPKPPSVLSNPKVFTFSCRKEVSSMKMVPGTMLADSSKQLSLIKSSPLSITAISPTLTSFPLNRPLSIESDPPTFTTVPYVRTFCMKPTPDIVTDMPASEESNMDEISRIPVTLLLASTVALL